MNKFKKNKCNLLASNNRFVCAELDSQNELTATREKANYWETFSLIELPNNIVAFKAANGKYLSMDWKSLRLFANGDSIGKQERFEMTIK